MELFTSIRSDLWKGKESRKHFKYIYNEAKALAESDNSLNRFHPLIKTICRIFILILLIHIMLSQPYSIGDVINALFSSSNISVLVTYPFILIGDCLLNTLSIQHGYLILLSLIVCMIISHINSLHLMFIRDDATKRLTTYFLLNNINEKGIKVARKMVVLGDEKVDQLYFYNLEEVSNE